MTSTESDRKRVGSREPRSAPEHIRRTFRENWSTVGIAAITLILCATCVANRDQSPEALNRLLVSMLPATPTPEVRPAYLVSNTSTPRPIESPTPEAVLRLPGVTSTAKPLLLADRKATEITIARLTATPILTPNYQATSVLRATATASAR